MNHSRWGHLCCSHDDSKVSCLVSPEPSSGPFSLEAAGAAVLAGHALRDPFGVGLCLQVMDRAAAAGRLLFALAVAMEKGHCVCRGRTAECIQTL